MNMVGEICDDGDALDDSNCKADCSGPALGYTCNGGSTSTPRVCTEACGDGVVTPAEECDDQNTNDLDGCS